MSKELNIFFCYLREATRSQHAGPRRDHCVSEVILHGTVLITNFSVLGTSLFYCFLFVLYWYCLGGEYSSKGSYPIKDKWLDELLNIKYQQTPCRKRAFELMYAIILFFFYYLSVQWTIFPCYVSYMIYIKCFSLI